MVGGESVSSGGVRDRARRVVVVVAILGCGPPMSAQEPQAGTALGWQAELRSVGEALLERQWARAETQVLELTSEMSEQIVGGSGADLLLGVATTYRALAAAGQGRQSEAIWHWQVAQQLFPRIADLDLSRFGPEAAALLDHPPRRHSSSPVAEPGQRAGVFVPPDRRDAPEPRFPAGRAFRGLVVDVVVQVVVGVDGRPGEPLILDSKGELTLVLAALDALRQWTFEPGRRDGVPEASLYTLTVRFVVPDG